MNFSKQKRRLYAFSFFSNFRITDAVWVVLLAARGYSLWQIGLAEGIFHITSLLCEVPSGAAADLLALERSEYSILPSDLIETLPQLLKQLEK